MGGKLECDSVDAEVVIDKWVDGDGYLKILGRVIESGNGSTTFSATWENREDWVLRWVAKPECR